MSKTEDEKRAARAAYMRQYNARNNEQRRAKRKAAYEADPEFFREKSRLWRAAHPERVKEYKANEAPETKRRWAREWRERNPDRLREMKRESHLRHKDEINARRRERLATDPAYKAAMDERTRRSYEKNRDKLLAKAKERRLANPGAQRAMLAEHRRKNPVSWYIYSIRKSAKADGVPFDLTVDWLKQRLDAGICEMSGVAFDRSKKRGANSPSVDRIIPGGPYTQANCRVILWSLNHALNNYGDDYMISLFRQIIARRDAANG